LCLTINSRIQRKSTPIAICGAVTWFGILFLCLFAQVSFAQEPSDTPTESEAAWQAPSLSRLPPDWWQQFDSPDPATFSQRAALFMGAATTSVQGLSGADLVTGENLLRGVRGQFDLLQVARQAPKPEPFKAILKQNQYSLDELLALRAQWRELRENEKDAQLRLEELESEAGMLQNRRDSLLRKYASTDENSPNRILASLERIGVRTEFELNHVQIRDLRKRMVEIQDQQQLLDQQIEFARQHLAAENVDLKARKEALTEAGQEVTRLLEKQSDAQQQLFSVLSDPDSKASLVILRKQQLTRTSAELALAQLRAMNASARLNWTRLHSGALDDDHDIQQSLEQAQALIQDTRRQTEVWTTASQDTLLAPVPAADLNSVKNIDLARTAAQETLSMVSDSLDVIDELQMLGTVLAVDQVDMQSGLRSVWTRFMLARDEIGRDLSAYLDFSLFHIGDVPVTLGRILTMLLILVLGFALSWFIRHLLERLKDRRQFAKSPAVYTLGRLLHYIIILVAVFAAFSSIGLDFRNFALIAGALSVGIGFGLQSIVNNFVSGLILLFEGSLRVGDYIELDTGLRGVVKEINTRATIVNTNDSIDVVVPNSQFVTTQLTNWTLRYPLARFRIEFGVAYGSDKEVVKAAALEAASRVEYIVQHMPKHKPEVWLVNFGDSALVFQLLVWVSRAGVQRPERVRCAVLWELETQLREHGIEIPFPQRDLHLRSGFQRPEEIPVKV
jgi:small-conductance mechanosensitive channel